MDPRLDALFVPDNPTKATQYRGVSPHHNGFRGRIKLAGLTHRTPVAPTPEGAARFIADELDKLYGPGWHWRMNADSRKRRPWRPVRWCAPSVSDPVPAVPRVVYRSPPEPRCDRHPRVFDPGRPRQPQPVECHVPAPPPRWRPAGCRLAAGGCEYRRGGPWRPVGWALEACEWGRPVVLGDHAAGHPAGDMAAYARGVHWASQLGLAVVAKLSQRMLVTKPRWLQDGAADLLASGLTIASRRCKGPDPFRTEAALLKVDAWAGSDAIAEAAAFRHGGRPKADGAERQFLDMLTRRGMAYLPWELLAENRRAKQPGVIWHHANDVADYRRLAGRFGVELPADFRVDGWGWELAAGEYSHG